MNIIDEIHIATGNRKKIRALVVPSLSMNALAVTDLRGDAVIAITEGLLSRINRPQLEAVMAHETYHILSGDCMEASIATSLFGVYAAAFEKARDFAEVDPRAYLAFLPARVLFALGQMVHMFISREREYRADAGALRMTRNPLAMAEVLQLLSRNWTGTGMISSGIEMLCLVKTKESSLEGDRNWWEGITSTHPPLGKRISVLLRMAGVSASAFDKKSTISGATGQAAAFPSAPEVAVYGTAEHSCPCCGRQLELARYEKTKIFPCTACGGALVENDKLPRIIARRERECTERVRSLAAAVTRDNQNKRMMRKRAGEKPVLNVLKCPKCKNPMMRIFYSYDYLVEVDRCAYCGLTWFDKDELEILQCLIENRIIPRAEMGV